MNVYLVHECSEELHSVLAVYASVDSAIACIKAIAYQNGLQPTPEEDYLDGQIAEYANESYSTVVWVEEMGVIEDV